MEWHRRDCVGNTMKLYVSVTCSSLEYYEGDSCHLGGAAAAFMTAHWPLNGAEPGWDVHTSDADSGSALDLSKDGSVTQTRTGPIGASSYFPDNDDERFSISGFDWASSARGAKVATEYASVTLWMKIVGDTASASDLFHLTTGAGLGYRLNVETDGKMVASVQTTDDTTCSLTSTSSLTSAVTRWTHLSMSYNKKGQLTLYRDGQRDAFVVCQGGANRPIKYSGNIELKIKGRNVLVKEVATYGRGLQLQDVRESYETQLHCQHGDGLVYHMSRYASRVLFFVLFFCFFV